jgi:DNA-binding NtrC family response regulator
MKNATVNATGFAVAKVLIVDDMEDARWVMSNLIRQAGFSPLLAANGEEALACIRNEMPDVALLDIGLPDMDGFEVLARAKSQDKTLQVIMVTANGKTHDAVRAIRAGAYDYVAKPFNNEDVILTVRRALEEKSLRRLHWQFLGPQPGQSGSILESMGKGAAVQRIQTEVERVARTNFSVLVTGESGTGKELVSQAIHACSMRLAKPFVAVDCGAIAETLIESELFGHEKGAFTGAHQAQAGAFEMADGGTIFLDEIGNLPLAMQGKLLRVLETRRIHRIGSTKEQEIDFRVVAATNADLLAMVDQQTFRGDLYHRLAEYTISIPSLRERKEDLGFLVHRFLAQTNKELGKRVQGLSAAAWDLIQGYSWPGNARELRNQLRRAVLLCDEPEAMVTPDCLGVLAGRCSASFFPDADSRELESRALDSHALESHAACDDGGPQVCPLCDSTTLFAAGSGLSLKELSGRVIAQLERTILLQALTLADGNKAQAARLLHMDYKTIHNKLKTYQISSSQFMKDAYGSGGRGR